MPKSAFGTILAKSGTAIARLNNIGGPSKTAETIDVTTHDSADGYREFIAGLKDGGEVSLEGILTGVASQTALNTDLDAGTVGSYTITFPNSIQWAFSGIVTALETTAPTDGSINFTASIKVTGKPSLSATYSAGLTTPFLVVSNSAVLVPAAANGTYTYVATVLTGVSSVTITPTATAGVITVNGTVVATGVASGAITLGAAGSITRATVVVTETGKLPRTYTVDIVRAAS